MLSALLFLAAASSTGAVRRIKQQVHGNDTGDLREESFLVLRVTFPGSAAQPMTEIKSACEDAWTMMRRDSYGRLNPKPTYKEVSLPNGWPTTWSDLWTLHDRVSNTVSNKDDYKLRVVYFPAEPSTFVGVADGLDQPKIAIQDRPSKWYTAVHEAAHGLGLDHSESILEGEEFGDCEAVMGVWGYPRCKHGYKFKHFLAPFRFQLGWLKLQKGEVVAAQSGRFSLTDLLDPLDQWSYKAVKLPCSSCSPQKLTNLTRYISNASLWVSYVQNRVNLHFWIGGGTEHWGQLEQVGEAWQPPAGTGFSSTVLWCARGEQQGKVWADIIIKDTVSQARSECGVTSPAWSLTGSGCVMDGNCIHSRNYPQDYGNNEACSVSLDNVPLAVEGSFKTEKGYDILSVNGVDYSGALPSNAAGLDGTHSGTLTWSSDHSVTSAGWKICRTDV